MNKPAINVTPLIDVLLVLLIIFMVVAPLKPSSFKTRIPLPPAETAGSHPDTLAVIVNSDSSLSLNKESGLGTIGDPAGLIERLRDVFRERMANGSIAQTLGFDRDRPYPDPAERTVFIKAPRSMKYGQVTRVVDAVKVAGAYPISLQIDHLHE